MASAGPYANLHIIQTDNHATIPPLSFNRPYALPAAQPTASKLDKVGGIHTITHAVIKSNSEKCIKIR